MLVKMAGPAQCLPGGLSFPSMVSRRLGGSEFTSLPLNEFYASTSSKGLFVPGTNHFFSIDSKPAKLFTRGPVRANIVKFKARREVKIPFRERSVPASNYLKETERVVRVTFPDSARIKYLGDSKWQSRLRPVTFFSLSATPCVELRVTYEKGMLRLFSNKLKLDTIGLPESIKIPDLLFSLQGELGVLPGPMGPKQVPHMCNFVGSVNLSLGVDLPAPFSLIPEGIVMSVGDEILDRIIGAMEGALLQGIVDDYIIWCRKQSKLVQPTQVQIAQYSPSPGQ
ncbi:unnamed protein product [Sphagnum jensenii]|uniref:Uncharacterized protein n=1 Tax=Sphagnum jensenii TaxID=128206 RepID=A0ABP1B9Z1_9BRYO